MDRKKSNSVTELVKTIAKEVMQDTIRSAVQEELRRERPLIIARYLQESNTMREKECPKRELEDYVDSFVHRLRRDTTSSAYKKPWGREEDLALKVEFEFAINHMAEKHGRSTGSIISRIRKKRGWGDENSNKR